MSAFLSSRSPLLKDIQLSCPSLRSYSQFISQVVFRICSFEVVFIQFQKPPPPLFCCGGKNWKPEFQPRLCD